MKLGHTTTTLSALKKSLLLDHQSLLAYFNNLKSAERRMPTTDIFVSESQDLNRMRSFL